MSYKHLCLASSLACLLVCFPDAASSSADIQTLKSLYRDKLDDYDTRIRPLKNQSAAIYINTKFVPQSLLEFDTSEQKFSMLGYFRIAWRDEVLIWNPDNYTGIRVLNVPIEQMWKPSIIILKAYDGHGVVGQSTDQATVLNDGRVSWVPEGIYSIVCNVDIQYYPFDEQTCTLTYYVSDETVRTVQLDHYLAVDLDEYSENSAWTIVSAMRRKYLLYNTFNIDIEFRLQRRANFTTFTLIMPLLMLAFLNICIFLVPIGSGEKGSFSITIFLSYGIFVTIISDTLPHNSLQVSFFVLFIVILLVLSVISVFYTIMQAKLVASIGEKECTWTCFKPRKKCDNSVRKFEDPNAHGKKTGKCETTEKTEKSEFSNDVSAAADDVPYTWAMFLEKLDIYLFVVFFILICATTAVFFTILLRHASKSAGGLELDPVPPATTLATF